MAGKTILPRSARNQRPRHGVCSSAEECGKFAKRIEQEKWHGWFGRAERGDEPWIFYMADDFIRHCFDMVHKLLKSFGAYCRGRYVIHTTLIE